MPVTVTGEAVTDDLVGRGGDRERRRSLGVGDVAVVRGGRQHDVALRGQVGRKPDERRQPTRSAVRPSRPRLPFRNPIEAMVGSVPKGEAARSGSSQSCSGISPTPDAKRAHPASSDGRLGRVAGRERMLGALGGQHRPQVAGALPARCPRVGRRCVDRHSRRRCSGASRGRSASSILIVASTIGSDSQDVGVVGRQLAEPDQLEEAGVDHRALVERRPAVADVVADRGVRIAGLRQPDEVRVRPTADRSSSPSSP